MSQEKSCVFCERTSDQVPLIGLEFRGTTLAICPQHMPVLIHDPGQLVGKMPGAENLSPADHKD
ncbi:MAG TPA: hypothetical protein ENJ29_01530 [Bacteroidetes bacterium]|nr:hypothetical protein [Bacteroidota bacterium]